ESRACCLSEMRSRRKVGARELTFWGRRRKRQCSRAEQGADRRQKNRRQGFLLNASALPAMGAQRSSRYAVWRYGLLLMTHQVEPSDCTVIVLLRSVGALSVTLGPPSNAPTPATSRSEEHTSEL